MSTLTLLAPLSGWLVPLDEVTDPVFASAMMGEGWAIDPLCDTLHAPAEVVAVHSAGHALTLRLDGGPEILLHFGLDTVGLGGEGFTPLVREGERVAAGQPLLRVDLDRVARRARSLVTPMVIAEPAGFTAEWRCAAGPVDVGQVLAELTAAEEYASHDLSADAPA